MKNWEPFGLYDPRWEHDACGIGFVAYRDGQATHDVVAMALTALRNLQHRGGVDADGKSGDGVGILTQVPHAFFAAVLANAAVPVPPVGDLAVAQCFLPPGEVAAAQSLLDAQFAAFDIPCLLWRPVPTNPAALGERARTSQPALWQALLQRPAAIASDRWEQALYLLRRAIERAALETGIALYLPSLSSRTIVFKGLLAAAELGNFYPDLQDERFCSALAVYHQRFSTNTLPTWERAQPFRMLSHNGEINTLAGNEAALQAREADFESPLWSDRIAVLKPVISDPRTSDSAKLDNALELLVQSGRSVAHALSMLVPAAWEEHPDLDPDLRAFYRFHAGLMAPWDGPAALCFADGQTAGIALDRNGLRPVRYLVADDGLVIVGSEAGAVPIDPARIVSKGRLGPGEMLLVDTGRGLILENAAIKRELAGLAPYRQWLEQFGRVFQPPQPPRTEELPLLHLQTLFGYTAEDVQVILKPMARDGHEPIGSMGDDTPVGSLTEVGRPLTSYLRQQFAQVTNPPIDPLREKLVMSVRVRLGHRRNILIETPAHAHLLELASPILRTHELAALQGQAEFPAATVDATFPVAAGAAGLLPGIHTLQGAAVAAAQSGAVLIVVSDRGSDAERAPIPVLLAVGAVHQALLGAGLRARTNIIAETGEARDVHQLACLLGCGAEAVQPYLALATAREEWIADQRASQKKSGLPGAIDPDRGETNYVAAVNEGLRKIMSKMGIATLDSYGGAKLFEVIGLAGEIVALCLPGMANRLGGIGWSAVGTAVLQAHAAAFRDDPRALRHHGIFKWKKDGEFHAHAPATVHALHAAVGIKPYAGDLGTAYRAYSSLVHNRTPIAPRDLMRPVARTPIAIDEVEPVESILQRFSTAAMSLGSTSTEAHTTLAIAMHRLGGMSNSGEGGEDPARYGDERNSDIKQVASARFGVTPGYLVSARELQIKMAQGSKPGEGGQLPGHKVTEEIARVRHTIPGVTLISPPPHHDIYSIEDLAQLIYDLRQVHPAAAVSVKLVAQAGVGTVAAGVVKAGADVVQISGHSGGTGASPLSSIKHAGISWELGLAETQQTLVLNGLRDRVRLRTDGGLQTGRDVLIAALLGADEYSFGTAAVVAEGCAMARSCHTNTCPVGIATQRPDLRAKFPGTPESVMHFFLHLATELRELLAELGARSVSEIVGHTELLERIHFGDPALDTLAIEALLVQAPSDAPICWSGTTQATPVSGLNARVLTAAHAALDGKRVELQCSVTNTDRTIGATLAGAIAARHGDAGLPTDTVVIHCDGSAGQSFGAFGIAGMRLDLEGEANDYVGKGLSGGTIVVRPPRAARFVAANSAIIGNTVLYGATGGALWAAGLAGERFAVRNSGALAVVEGVGDHGCEYMTGGTVVVLGAIGRNFGAGMTGGLAYVWDRDGTAPLAINGDMVNYAPVTDAWELDELRQLVEQHGRYTGSQRARELLDTWETSASRFLRIAPHGAAATLSLPARVLQVGQALNVERRT